MRTVAEISVDPDTAEVHEQGWQSWSPSTRYRIGERPHRWIHGTHRIVCYRGDADPTTGVFRGEGLLAVDPRDGGPVTVIAAADPTATVPTIEASYVDGRVVVRADGDVVVRLDDGPGGVQGSYARWADQVVADLGLTAPRPAPTTWCSWYQYFTGVTEADVDLNLGLMAELELPVDVVQVDDGYQQEIGDWLVPSGRFADVPGLFRRITDHGRRAGIWTAPFLVGSRSRTFAEHPDWLVRDDDGGPTSAGANWGQDLFALDTTHPGAVEYLREVFTAFQGWGIDFHKIDFIYAGALPGRRHEDVTPIEAYRRGVELIRDCVGDSYLLGCGAPQLPSIGLVDAMRVSPDIAPVHAPADGDLSQPSQRGAVLNGVSRAFQHGRFWVNDPDCLITRPDVERREEWAEHVSRFGGLRGASDGLDKLDDWALETTRALLGAAVPRHFVAS
ncbi:glycoside hydrolase family 36 protein [Umezawaea tangerina]|uniref:Alpha-galactosidase n=1 Tax=Umezawaea tangerina TaxID=84725 RepID=A0A2T0TLS5_9PSEU|nr:glycoside hydrolase family 36 protein [Umezawaea tangerina]PRY46571.1 alpha-galactosidase [Umezawaea tangerina]